MTPDEILNKIWNPDQPIVLVDPPLTPLTVEGQQWIKELVLIHDAVIPYPNLIKQSY